MTDGGLDFDWDALIKTAMYLDLTLDEFEDYSPRLLQLRADVYRQKRDRETHLLAWLQANIMNRLRWTKTTPKVTVDGLLGRPSRTPSSKEQLIMEMRREVDRMAERKTLKG